jgi:hypothetical protein
MTKLTWHWLPRHAPRNIGKRHTRPTHKIILLLKVLPIVDQELQAFELLEAFEVVVLPDWVLAGFEACAF